MSDVLKHGAKKDSGIIVTPEARWSFPYLFTPKKSKKEGRPDKYMLSLLFHKDTDLGVLKTAVIECAVENLGQDKTKWPKNLKTPFRQQSEKAGQIKGYEEEGVFIIATSKKQPGVVDAKVQRIINPSDVYGGCYGVASLRAFFYKEEGNVGISFGLVNCQKTRDGEPLGGRSTPEMDFESVDSSESAPVGSGPMTVDSLFN